MNFFQKIGVGLTQLFGLIIPLLAKAPDFRRWGPGLLWTIRILFLLGILVLLWFINNYVWNPIKLFGHAPNRTVMRLWLPLLFLLFVSLSWLGWWLWKLLTPAGETSDFPDIDAAWEEARAALNGAGIDLTAVPLFLVLGRPASSEEALFQAGPVPLQVRHVPRGADAPAHVYADRDAIYLTCAGASVLGKHAALLAKDEDVPGGADVMAPALSRAGDNQGEYLTLDLNATLAMATTKGVKGDALREVHAILVRAQRERRPPTPAEKKRMRQLSGVSRPSLLKNTAVVERQSARLRHLCRLVARDRRPYCPLNGILVLIPFGATDSEEDAAQAAQVVQVDLTTARQAFQIYCPLLTLVCDLETTAGFREFLERIPERNKKNRLGLGFPLVPTLEPSALPGMIESGVQWLCQTLFPTWIYKFFQVEGPARGNLAQQVQANTQLYRLMYEMRQRQKPLSRILTRGLLTDPTGPLLLGGCYVAPTGREAREQAFIAGVLQKLVLNQNYVSWSADAMTEENDYHRWTRTGYITVGVFTLFVLVAGFFWAQSAR